MPVREFRDRQGVLWRAWEIMPESIHPQTKAEDYLAGCYEVGWLVLERNDEQEKRRLCPVPMRWAERTEAELQILLEQAEPVRAADEATPPGAAGQRSTAPADAAPSAEPPATSESFDLTDLGVVRSFRYPGGRLWTVCVVRRPENGGPPVLRFTAGMRYVDLADWPRDWPDYPDERLVELLRAAAPRKVKGELGADTPRRRHDDPPQGTP